MKIIDFSLLKEVIAEIEKNSSEENPTTEEEKILATERLYKDYQDGKSKIPEYRQQVIDDTIYLSKRINKNRFENFVDRLDEDIEEINKYIDDYVYLLYMITSTTAKELRQRLKIANLGKELITLVNELNKSKNSPGDLSIFSDLLLQVKKKGAEIDDAVIEVHILKIMNTYYKHLSKYIINYYSINVYK